MPDATSMLGIGLAMLSISGPITAAIIKAKWSGKPAAAAPPTNGGKVDIREFAEFREEIRGVCRDIKGDIEALRLLIVKHL